MPVPGDAIRLVDILPGDVVQPIGGAGRGGPRMCTAHYEEATGSVNSWVVAWADGTTTVYDASYGPGNTYVWQFLYRYA